MRAFGLLAIVVRPSTNPRDAADQPARCLGRYWSCSSKRLRPRSNSPHHFRPQRVCCDAAVRREICPRSSSFRRAPRHRSHRLWRAGRPPSNCFRSSKRPLDRAVWSSHSPPSGPDRVQRESRRRAGRRAAAARSSLRRERSLGVLLSPPGVHLALLVCALASSGEREPTSCRHPPRPPPSLSSGPNRARSSSAGRHASAARIFSDHDNPSEPA